MDSDGKARESSRRLGRQQPPTCGRTVATSNALGCPSWGLVDLHDPPLPAPDSLLLRARAGRSKCSAAPGDAAAGLASEYLAFAAPVPIQASSRSLLPL